MDFNKYFFRLNPGFVPLPFSEKIRSGFAAFVGIALLGLGLRFLSGSEFALLMPASMAAAAVLLYAAPHSPMAQPWPLLAGNLISGMVGWGCLAIPDPVLSLACAIGFSVFVMHLLGCLHPPGAATAMGIVLDGEAIHHHSWQWTAVNLTVNVLLALLAALLVNNLMGRRYPLRRTAPAAPAPTIQGEPDKEDVAWALQQVGGMVDVDEEELLEICRLAAERAQSRQAGANYTQG